MTTKPVGLGPSVPAAQPGSADVPPVEKQARQFSPAADTFVRGRAAAPAAPHTAEISIEQAEAQAVAAAPGLGIQGAQVEDSFSGAYLTKLRAGAQRMHELEAKVELTPSESRELGEVWVALDRFAYAFAAIEQQIPTSAWASTLFVDLVDTDGVRVLVAVDASGKPKVADRTDAPLDVSGYEG